MFKERFICLADFKTTFHDLVNYLGKLFGERKSKSVEKVKCMFRRPYATNCILRVVSDSEATRYAVLNLNSDMIALYSILRQCVIL